MGGGNEREIYGIESGKMMKHREAIKIRLLQRSNEDEQSKRVHL